jgi:hypothetical protein
MKLPAITIKIEPVSVDKVTVVAEWQSPDGAKRKLAPNATHDIAMLDGFLGDLVQEMFDEILTIEERNNA